MSSLKHRSLELELNWAKGEWVLGKTRKEPESPRQSDPCWNGVLSSETNEICGPQFSLSSGITELRDSYRGLSSLPLCRSKGDGSSHTRETVCQGTDPLELPLAVPSFKNVSVQWVSFLDRKVCLLRSGYSHLGNVLVAAIRMAPREHGLSAAIETKHKVALARMPLCYFGLSSGRRATCTHEVKGVSCGRILL